MECVEAKELHEGQVSAPGAEPKDEGSTERRSFERGKAQLLEQLRSYSPIFRKKLLLDVLAEVSQVTDKADQLNQMEQKIREIYHNLDVKTKVIISAEEGIRPLLTVLSLITKPGVAITP